MGGQIKTNSSPYLRVVIALMLDAVQADGVAAAQGHRPLVLLIEEVEADGAGDGGALLPRQPQVRHGGSGSGQLLTAWIR